MTGKPSNDTKLRAGKQIEAQSKEPSSREADGLDLLANSQMHDLFGRVGINLDTPPPSPPRNVLTAQRMASVQRAVGNQAVTSLLEGRTGERWQPQRASAHHASHAPATDAPVQRQNGAATVPAPRPTGGASGEAGAGEPTPEQIAEAERQLQENAQASNGGGRLADGRQAPAPPTPNTGAADGVPNAAQAAEAAGNRAESQGNAQDQRGGQAAERGAGRVGRADRATSGNEYGQGGGPRVRGTPAGAAPPGFDVWQGQHPEYAEEKAHHDSWVSAGSPTQSSQGNDLVLDALTQGAADGISGGVQAMLIDTVLNKATRRIPYAAGFIAVADFARSPTQFARNQRAAIWDNGLAGGFRRIANARDWVDVVEGVLNILEGANAIAQLIATICLVIAAASFLLGLIPGLQWLLPIAAVAGQWGVTIGTYSTYAGLIISALRLLLMGARAIQIKLAEGNPERQRQLAESLRNQTASFTQEYTSRRLNRARAAREQRSQQRNNQVSQQSRSQAQQQSQTTQSGRQQSRAARAAAFTERVASGLVGAGGSGMADVRGQAADHTGRATGMTGAAWRNRNADRATWVSGIRNANPDAFSEGTNRRLNQWSSEERTRRQAQQAQAAYDDMSARLDAARRRAAAADAAHEQARENAARTARENRAVAGHDPSPEMREAARTLGRAEADLARHQADRQRLPDLLQERQRSLQVARSRAGTLPPGHPNARRSQNEIRALQAEVTMLQNAIRNNPQRIAAAQQAVEQATRQRDDAATARAHEMLPEGQQAIDRTGREARTANQQAGALVDIRAGVGAERDRAVAAHGTDVAANSRENLDRQHREDFRTGVRDTFADFRRRNIWAGATGGDFETVSGYGHQATGGGATGIGTDTLNRQDVGADGQQQQSLTEQGGDIVGRALGLSGGRGTMMDGWRQRQNQEWERRQQLSTREELPPPPVGAENRLDEAAADWVRADGELQYVRSQRAEHGPIQAEINRQEAAIEATRGVRESTQSQVEQNESEVDRARQSQDAAAERIQSEQGRSGEVSGQSESRGSTLQPVVNAFVGVMSRVPSRVVSNSGEGQSAANNVREGLQGGARSGQASQEGLNQEQVCVDEHRAGADQATATNTEATGNLDQLGTMLDEDATALTQSRQHTEELQASGAQSESTLLRQREAAATRHADAESEMLSWVERHRQARNPGR